MLEQIPVNDNEKTIAIGSLTLLEHNGKENWYYVSPVAGGKLLQVDGTTVLVISAFSPMAPELIGSELNDEFVVETPKGEKEYKILKII